jgi:hypothetical protein
MPKTLFFYTILTQSHNLKLMFLTYFYLAKLKNQTKPLRVFCRVIK